MGKEHMALTVDSRSRTARRSLGHLIGFRVSSTLCSDAKRFCIGTEWKEWMKWSFKRPAGVFLIWLEAIRKLKRLQNSDVEGVGQISAKTKRCYIGFMEMECTRLSF